MLVAFPLYASNGFKGDPLCAPLRTFVRSVLADQTRTLPFNTVWGGDFKSMASRSIYQKQCIAHGYAPAEAVCKVLMQHGAVEFSGYNAMRAVACLSPDTRFASGVRLQHLQISFAFGTPNRGSTVTISYGAASKKRGMVMRITAEGY
jgi:hypothetical protein